MANVTRYETKGGPRWRVRYRKPDGTQTDKRGFRRKADADRWAAEHITVAKASGMFVDPQGGRALVGDLHGAWVTERSPFWKPSHVAREASLWRVHCEGEWARRRVGDITHAEVQRWVSGLAGRRSASVVLGAYGVLRAVCANAVRDRLIQRSPCEGVELPRKPRRKARRVYLTMPELVAFADEAANSRRQGASRRALVLTLGLCGLRWGEAAGLRVGDVDLAQGVIHVRHNTVRVNFRPVDGTPKSSEERTVPMPAIVIDAIRPLLVGLPADGRVFTDPNGGPVRQQSAVDSPANTSWWPQTLRRLGWDSSRWPTPHDLRHTFASIAVHAGANVKALQRMMGHASAAMTLDVYADLFDSDLLDVVRLIDAAVMVEVPSAAPEGCGQNVGKMGTAIGGGVKTGVVAPVSGDVE